MSLFRSLRSSRRNTTNFSGDPEAALTGNERTSENSSSFGAIIKQFPDPPTPSPDADVQMSLRGHSTRSSALRISRSGVQITDQEGLPLIPSDEIGRKWPTPTPGLSTTSSLIPRSPLNPSYVHVPRNASPTDNTIRSRRMRRMARSLTPAELRVGEGSVQKHNHGRRRSQSATGLGVSTRHNEGRAGDGGFLARLTNLKAAKDHPSQIAPPTAGEDHLLFYGRSPSFTRQILLQHHGPDRQLRAASLPIQTPLRGPVQIRRNSMTDSNAEGSNVALSSSISEASVSKRQDTVVRSHPRYVDAYKSLTTDLASSSSTQLSNFAWSNDDRPVALPRHIVRHKYYTHRDQVLSSASDCNISEEYSDYADIYEDAPGPTNKTGRLHAPGGTSPTGFGHKRQGTPPLLFGTRAMEASVPPASPPSPTRSNSRLARAAEAVGLQQSGRLMRAITTTSERDWETVAETEYPGTAPVDVSSSYVNNSTSESDMKPRGLPSEPQPLPQPTHPRYVQSWTLQKELDASHEVLVPSPQARVGAQAPDSPVSSAVDKSYQHPSPLSNHTNPFSSSPMIAERVIHVNQNPTAAPSEAGLLSPITAKDDRSVSNYSDNDQEECQGSSTWVSTASPMQPLPRSRGHTSYNTSSAVAGQRPVTTHKAELVKSEIILPKRDKHRPSSSVDTGSSIADLSSSPVPLTSSPLIANAGPSSDAEGRKYTISDGEKYQSIEEPDLTALPAASRKDFEAQQKLLNKEDALPKTPSRSSPKKRPTSSTPLKRLASASSSVKGAIDAAASRGSLLILPVVTPRSSQHGSPQNRALAHGITNSTAIELQPLSPPHAHRAQSKLKRRAMAPRFKRRKSTLSNPRSPLHWDDTTPKKQTRLPTVGKAKTSTSPGTPSKGTSTALSPQAANIHETTPPKPSGAALSSPQPLLMSPKRFNQGPPPLLPYTLSEDPILSTIRRSQYHRSTIRPAGAQPAIPISHHHHRPIASSSSPHLHTFPFPTNNPSSSSSPPTSALASQKHFSRLLIILCLPLFPTLLLLGSPGSDRVVRMLSNGRAEGFYRPYVLWVRGFAIGVLSAGVAAMVVVGCMGGF